MKYTRKTFWREFGILIVGAVFSIPFFLLVSISLRKPSITATSFSTFPHHPSGASFAYAWNNGGMGRALVSSTVITAASVVLLVLFGSMSAYTLARRASRLSSGMYYLFLISIIIPAQLGTVPLYVVFRHLGLVGSYFGMIILWTGLAMPTTVFLYAGFIRALPRDYEEAANVDGASFVRLYLRIVLPLLRPITGTVAILVGLLIWNDFFFALIFLSGSRWQTLPVALYSFVGEYTTQWSVIFAAAAIALLPMMIFFVFMQQQMMRGFTGGIRG